MRCRKKQSITTLATACLPTQGTIRKPLELTFTLEGIRRVMKDAVNKRTTKIHEHHD